MFPVRWNTELSILRRESESTVPKLRINRNFQSLIYKIVFVSLKLSLYKIECIEIIRKLPETGSFLDYSLNFHEKFSRYEFSTEVFLTINPMMYQIYSWNNFTNLSLSSPEYERERHRDFDLNKEKFRDNRCARE